MPCPWKILFRSSRRHSPGGPSNTALIGKPALDTGLHQDCGHQSSAHASLDAHANMPAGAHQRHDSRRGLWDIIYCRLPWRLHGGL